MKKLTTYVVIITMMTALITGCKGKDKVTNDPKAVVTAFFERMSKKDIDGAAKLATKESKATMDMMKKAMDAAEKMGMKDSASKEDDPSEEFKKMEIGEAKIDGDKATVSVTNHAKGDKIQEFPLVKEGGEWKVDFSMATLMKMGMDEAGKSGMDDSMNDSDTSGIRDFMTDTLKKSLNELDDALKELDPEKMKEMKDALKELEKIKE